jgi:hypothetical protein
MEQQRLRFDGCSLTNGDVSAAVEAALAKPHAEMRAELREIKALLQAMRPPVDAPPAAAAAQQRHRPLNHLLRAEGLSGRLASTVTATLSSTAVRAYERLHGCKPPYVTVTYGDTGRVPGNPPHRTEVRGYNMTDARDVASVVFAVFIAAKLERGLRPYIPALLTRYGTSKSARLLDALTGGEDVWSTSDPGM